MSDRRVLAGSSATIRIAVRDADGEPVEPSSGTWTVAVVDSAGDTVTGSPFAATVANEQVEFDLPATATATVEQLTCTARLDGTPAGTAVVEVVGGFLYGLAELRTFDQTLANQANYPNDDLADMRIAVEERIEDLCARAFVPRLRIETSDPHDGMLMLGRADVRTIRSLTVDGTTVDVDLVDVRAGRLIHLPAGCRTGPATVVYEAGLDTCPAPVNYAAKQLAAHVGSSDSAMPSRATAQTFGDTVFRVTVAGRDGATGLPEVDVVLREWSARTALG